MAGQGHLFGKKMKTQDSRKKNALLRRENPFSYVYIVIDNVLKDMTVSSMRQCWKSRGVF